MKLAKKIADFLKKPRENYIGHSFRRSGATAMVEGRGTTNQLLVSDVWASEQIACGYYKDSKQAAGECQI